MTKMIALMSACALLTTISVVDAQNPPRDDKAKTQGDIMGFLLSQSHRRTAKPNCNGKARKPQRSQKKSISNKCEAW